MAHVWDELARDLYYHNVPSGLCDELAEALYNKGWRKNVATPTIINQARVQSINLMPEADPRRGIHPIKIRN